MGLIRSILTGAFLALVAALPARAAEITVLSGGAIEPGLRAAAARFQEISGHDVKMTFNTTPQILKRVAAGDLFDVIVAPPKAVAEFAEAGKVTGAAVPVGRVGAGIAMRPGTPVPPMGNTEEIKQAVLAADAVIFNRASSGQYIESLFRKMGIWDRVSAKAQRFATGAEALARVMAGSGTEIAFAPITEILKESSHGLVYVRPLPPDIQKYTSYVAVPMTAASTPQAAAELAAFLGNSQGGRPLFRAMGID